MFERIKRSLTAQIPEISVVLDATPLAESEIEVARTAVRAERVRLKRSISIVNVTLFVITLFSVGVVELLNHYGLRDIVFLFTGIFIFALALFSVLAISHLVKQFDSLEKLELSMAPRPKRRA